MILGAATIFAASQSSLLAWRDPIYITACFAGIIAFVLLYIQPLLISERMPGISVSFSRLLHRATGMLIVVGLILHLAGLWITSPPDVVDALLFRSPTAFSLWGVLGLLAVILNLVLINLRKPLKLRPRVWRLWHKCLAAVIVLTSIIHVLLIEGTMQSVLKWILCLFIALATVEILFNVRLFAHVLKK